MIVKSARVEPGKREGYAQVRETPLKYILTKGIILREETERFCFLAGHESFATAEGAIGIARSANKVGKKLLRVILNSLGKDAAYIISRINGFTYCQIKFDYSTGNSTNPTRFQRPVAGTYKKECTLAGKKQVILALHFIYKPISPCREVGFFCPG